MRVPTSAFYRQESLRFSEQYDRMSTALRQGTGDKLRLQFDSDDPVLATDVHTTEGYLNDLTGYGTNSTLAADRTKTYDISMQNVIGSVQQLSSQTTLAATQTLSDTSRAALASQIESNLQSILRVAKTQDVTGQYIFSGYNTDSPAFILENDGKYHYQGSYDTTTINIGLNAEVVYGDSGFNVFGSIPTGNGTFTIAPTTTNTGTIEIGSGNATNSTPFVKDDYTLSFTNVAGVNYYQLTGVTSGTVIPATVYVPGTTITANGMAFTLKGAPNAGDSFSIKPSQNQNVFDTMTNLVNLLRTPIGDDLAARSRYATNLNQYTASMDQVLNHLISFQANIGTRGQQIDIQANSLLSLTNIQKNIWTNLATVPDYESISNMKSQMSALDMTTGMYAQLQRALSDMLKKFS
ncbi:MAG: flagellar hook-associated protein FlgL [Gammaproteobacteria bacterium]